MFGKFRKKDNNSFFAEDYEYITNEEEKNAIIDLNNFELKYDLGPPNAYLRVAKIYRKYKRYKDEYNLLVKFLKKQKIYDKSNVTKTSVDKIKKRLYKLNLLLKDELAHDTKKDEKNLISSYVDKHNGDANLLHYDLNNNYFKNIEDANDYYTESIVVDKIPYYGLNFYDYDTHNLPASIKKFYSFWKNSWLNNRPIQLNGSHGYLLLYLFDLVNDIKEKNSHKYDPISFYYELDDGLRCTDTFDIYETITSKLPYVRINDANYSLHKKVINEYKNVVINNAKSDICNLRSELFKIKGTYRNDFFENDNIIFYHLNMFLVHTYMLTNDYYYAACFMEENFDEMQNLNNKSKSLFDINFFLSLKHYVCMNINGRDLLKLFSPSKLYTDLYKEEYNNIANELSNIIRNFEAINNVHLLSFLVDKCAYLVKRYDWPAAGILHGREFLPVEFPIYKFSSSHYILTHFKEWLTDAENNVRVNKNLPKIGQGWINETYLFNIISEIFQKYKVYHHARLSSMQGLELDIYIPELNIAIEYQGKQHFYPIDFFGGEKEFIKLQKRDNKKKQLCEDNNINLVEFKYNECIDKENVMKKLSKYVDITFDNNV